jgi:hypothetical protein
MNRRMILTLLCCFAVSAFAIEGSRMTTNVFGAKCRIMPSLKYNITISDSYKVNYTIDNQRPMGMWTPSEWFPCGNADIYHDLGGGAGYYVAGHEKPTSVIWESRRKLPSLYEFEAYDLNNNYLGEYKNNQVLSFLLSEPNKVFKLRFYHARCEEFCCIEPVYNPTGGGGYMLTHRTGTYTSWDGEWPWDRTLQHTIPQEIDVGFHEYYFRGGQGLLPPSVEITRVDFSEEKAFVVGDKTYYISVVVGCRYNVRDSGLGTLHIDYGDGVTQTFSVLDWGDRKFQHTYNITRNGGDVVRESYDISLTLTNELGIVGESEVVTVDIPEIRKLGFENEVASNLVKIEHMVTSGGTIKCRVVPIDGVSEITDCEWDIRGETLYGDSVSYNPYVDGNARNVPRYILVACKGDINGESFFVSKLVRMPILGKKEKNDNLDDNEFLENTEEENQHEQEILEDSHNYDNSEQGLLEEIRDELKNFRDESNVFGDYNSEHRDYRIPVEISESDYYPGDGDWQNTEIESWNKFRNLKGTLEEIGREIDESEDLSITIDLSGIQELCPFFEGNWVFTLNCYPDTSTPWGEKLDSVIGRFRKGIVWIVALMGCLKVLSDIREFVK